MPEVINVRFRGKGKAYYFDPAGNAPRAGDDVIVETAKGPELGQCVRAAHFVEDTAVVQPLRPVLRIATEADEETLRRNREKEKMAFELCERKIAARKLDMKLVDVEYSFDGNKVLFFFTSEGRVDFRELVKDLAGVLRTRIELRQIGVRDSAKLVGGLGICGRPFCCSSFLENFQPVSIKMAKTQSLSLNPAKISGTCGRLMCCLKYEQEAYEHLIKTTPKVDAPVDTPEGPGNITEVNLLRGRVKVKLADQSVNDVRQYPLRELGYTIGGVYKEPEPPEEPIPEPEEERFPFGGYRIDSSYGPGDTLRNETEEEKAEPNNRRRRNRRHKGKGGQQAEAAAPRQQEKPKQPEKAADKPAQDKPRQDRPKQEQRHKPKPQPQDKPAQTQERKKEQGGEQQKKEGGSRRRNRNHRGEHGPKPELPQTNDEKARARADAVAEAVAAAGGQPRSHRPRRRYHKEGGNGEGAKE